MSERLAIAGSGAIACGLAAVAVAKEQERQPAIERALALLVLLRGSASERKR